MAFKRLPHFHAPGLIQHVVFCTKDAHADGEDDAELDVSPRGRVLADPVAAAIVQEVLLRRNGDGYWLHAWCVMPNHAHVLVETRSPSLAKLVQSWKSISARELNAAWGRTGSVWQANYFDRFMREDEQIGATIAYIENNPVRAGLALEPSRWPWSSAWRGER